MSKILIATPDLIGPVVNGGIGTACTALAEKLVDDGHNVTILFTHGAHVEPRVLPPERQHELQFRYWVDWYDAKRISLIALPELDQRKYSQEHLQFAISHSVYEWCKDKDFDYIIVPEWGGMGAFLSVGSRIGNISAKVIVWTHSPTLWHVEMNGVTTEAITLEIDSLEAMSIRWADIVVSPSHYLIEWLNERNIRNKNASLVVRNEPTQTIIDRSKKYERGNGIDQIVFFGRLEYRKGLDLFAKAILNIMEKHDVAVTFLGKNSSMNGADSVLWLNDVMKQAKHHYRILPNMNQEEALDLISQPGVLAVMPSRVENYPYTVLEAYSMGVPLVACNTGGTSEIVQCPAMLCEPDVQSLQNAIERWITEYPIDEVIESQKMENFVSYTWDHIFRIISKQQEEKVIDSLVTIVIPTYNRPLMLQRALKSCQVQTYDNIEIVVVDDHSEPENADKNEALADQFGAEYIYHGTNDYLGASRQTGVYNASGEFIVYLDDDNLLKKDAIDIMLRAAAASDAHIVVSPLQIFQGSPENVVSIYTFTGELSGAFFTNKLGEACHMITRELAMIFDWTTERTGHEDWEYLTNFALHGFRIFPLPDPIVLYSQSPDGMLHSGDPIANTKRSMRPWYYQDVPTYPLRNILEIAHVQARMKGFYLRQIQLLQQRVYELEHFLNSSMNQDRNIKRVEVLKPTRGKRR